MSLRHHMLGVSAILALLSVTETAAAQEVFRWKFAHGGQVGHASHITSVKLAEQVEEKSGGRLILEIFPDRQLGEEKDLLEGLQLGSIDASYLSTGPLGNIVPEFLVLDIPFLIEDVEHAAAVFDGPVGQEMMEGFLPHGIEALGVWENGWRHLTSSRPVTSLDDMQGLKVRTMANDVHISAFQTLGAGPVPMAWGEVYTSLEQGVIDGQENSIATIAMNSLWEVQDNVTLTGHVYGVHVVLVSSASMEELPEDLQEILRAEVAALTPSQRALNAQLDEEALAVLRENGMEIHEIDRATIQEKLTELTPDFEERFGADVIERIRAEAD